MNLWRLARRNAYYKWNQALLGILLLGFGVGLISVLILGQSQLEDKLRRNIRNVDLVLGAKGSGLQLILANVYHIDAPTGNINKADASRIIKNPLVEAYVPLAYGDNYRGFRIVGTTTLYPQWYEMKLLSGVLFDKPFEVTIGAEVASATGAQVGALLISAHTEDEQGAKHDAHPLQVVGVMAPCDCALDRLVLTPLETVWGTHELEEEHANFEIEDSSDVSVEMLHGKEGGANEEVTAYLIRKRSPMAAMMLNNIVRNSNMQLADPAIEMNRLNKGFGIGKEVITGLAVLIMLMSGISLFIYLYQTMKERRYELALLRVMGGKRNILFRLILLESVFLTIPGFILGIVISRISMLVLSTLMHQAFHDSFNPWTVDISELWLFFCCLLLGISAAILPAWRAMRIDINKILSNDQ
jgi:putative ABC transport system permease protein